MLMVGIFDPISSTTKKKALRDQVLIPTDFLNFYRFPRQHFCSWCRLYCVCIKKSDLKVTRMPAFKIGPIFMYNKAKVIWQGYRIRVHIRPIIKVQYEPKWYVNWCFHNLAYRTDKLNFGANDRECVNCSSTGNVDFTTLLWEKAQDGCVTPTICTAKIVMYTCSHL
jgi:hypothetical protein